MDGPQSPCPLLTHNPFFFLVADWETKGGFPKWSGPMAESAGRRTLILALGWILVFGGIAYALFAPETWSDWIFFALAVSGGLLLGSQYRGGRQSED